MRTFARLLAIRLFQVSLVMASVTGPEYCRASGVNVIGPKSNLEIANKVVSPDGFNRSAILAGGTFPGPLIQAQKGDTFNINVINSLNDTSMNTTTSVHWHGIFQHRTNWADGADSVTQCPIPPNKSFLYAFNVPDQAGTYWYHSHVSAQYCDGLRGGLVIYDPEDPLGNMYDVDDESTVIVLSDWYHKPSPQVLSAPFTPDATLINGLGRYSGGPATPLAVINVEQGKRYRFRIIAAACEPGYNFTIDGHQMTIIETDGIEIEPVVVDSLAIFPGQRYSVVVSADKPVDNYWIRALPDNPSDSTFDGGLNSAILRYSGAPIQDPTTTQGPYLLSFDESALHPLSDAGAPGVPEVGKADVNINLEILLPSTDYTVNGVSWAGQEELPILLQILSGAGNASQLLPKGSVYELPHNRVIEISMPATDLTAGGATGAPHPMHLHGHSFDVIRVAGNSTYNFVNPVRRDTVSTGTQANNDNVTIRFRTNNPGPWFLHCHKNWHLRAGLGVVMAESIKNTAAEEKPPASWSELCSAQVH
ncbi:hypothetical protein ID866_4327 [Astraeus odoratus]|nr:hypothetical protein ID866_4327 [Astraeus odoratus]